MNDKIDVAVVGGGPAGLAAAIEAADTGAHVLLIERDRDLGGILQQCIHAGFGLHIFGEELTGPEYAQRFIDELASRDIEVTLDSMAMEIGEGFVTYTSPEGIRTCEAGAVILAMGCRERTRGMIGVPGARPAGIFTAGAAQRFVNIEGYLPGHKVVILGSGDIGLIMARRLTLEGAEVKLVCEVMPDPGGLARNIAQCLDDFNIPLLLSHTVIDVHGKDRLTGVTIAEVDERRRPIPGTEKDIECDTLLLSVGLIPENELTRHAGAAISPVTGGPVVSESMETSIPGVFACGNVVHVHDLVDHVTDESRLCGRKAALYALGKAGDGDSAVSSVEPGEGVRYVVPYSVRWDAVETARRESRLYFRVVRSIRGAEIEIKADGRTIKKIRRPRVAPGEMESVLIDEKLAEAARGCSRVTVEVHEKSAAK